MQPSDKPEAKPRRMLSQVVHEKLRAGHYSRRTEEAYLGWIRRFIRFHGGQHPRQLREPEVVSFLEDLAGTKAAKGRRTLPPTPNIQGFCPCSLDASSSRPSPS